MTSWFICSPMPFPPQGETGTKPDFEHCPQCGKINKVKEVVCPKCLNGDKDKMSSEEKKRYSTEIRHVNGKQNSNGKKDQNDCRECCQHCCCKVKCRSKSIHSQQQATPELKPSAAQQPLAQYGFSQQPFVQQPVQQPFIQQPVQQPFQQSVQQPFQQPAAQMPIQQPVTQMPIQQPVAKYTPHHNYRESPFPLHDSWSTACGCEKDHHLGFPAPLPSFVKCLLLIAAAFVFLACTWTFITSKHKGHGSCGHK